MKAITYRQYGGPEVLQLSEVNKPTPKDNEVLIKIHATTVTSADTRLRAARLPKGFALLFRLAFGISGPRKSILGVELSGVIEAIGKDVTRFKVGDSVFAICGTRMGCYAEYQTLPETGAIALKPAALSYEEAAALSFGGNTALDFFERAKIKQGDHVLIVGASGCVGSAAVQIAKHFGARVTGVCSAANVAWVKSLGAEHVIDYTKEDFTQGHFTYDIIMDTVGTAPFSRSSRILKTGGRLLLVLAGLPEMLRAPWDTLTNDKKVIAGPVAETSVSLQTIAQLAEAGEFRPFIDRRFKLAQIAQAHAYVDQGHKKGNVSVVVAE